MGSKGGGGGYDTGAMLDYGNRALALQEEMYNDQKGMIQPWVNTGSSALDKLGIYLGLTPGASPASRQSLLDQYKDQFTTTSETTAQGQAGSASGDSASWIMGQMGIKPDMNTVAYLQGQQSQPTTTKTTTTDQAALNAYVDKLIAEQEARGSSDPNYGSLLKSFGMDQFQADPGYQFRLDEQNKAIERAAAARGQYFDPSTVKALTEYGGNLADQTYNDAYNRYNNDQNNIFNRLAAVAGLGQTATGQMVNSSQNYANQAGNIYGQMGNAVTAANAAKASQPSMFDTLLGAGVQLGSSYLFSDVRAKENVERIGSEGGFPIYAFNYKGGRKRFKGVMAQDVEKIMPEAVIERSDGMKMVNYGMIGIEMEEIH